MWQSGYGGFSYSNSQIRNFYDHIKNQESHHAGKTIREEYPEFLNKNDIRFEDQYLFEFFD